MRQTRQMEHAAARRFAPRPRRATASAPIMSDMQNASPIRRYVLLRQRDLGAPAARWSMERIAAHAPRDGERSSKSARRPQRAS
jgi:hypothetical protein